MVNSEKSIVERKKTRKFIEKILTIPHGEIIAWNDVCGFIIVKIQLLE